MRKTKAEAELTRGALLKAALRVFSRNGYSATTLADVAQEAGVTRGAIYWHFGSKAELYIALVNEYSKRGSEIVQNAAAEGGSLAEVLRRIFIRLLAAVETDPALRAMMEISLFKTERTPDLASSLSQQIESSRRLLEGITEVMRSGIAGGELRADIDPAEMAHAYLALQNGTLYMWLQDPTVFSLQESAPALADLFLQGVLAGTAANRHP